MLKKILDDGVSEGCFEVKTALFLDRFQLLNISYWYRLMEKKALSLCKRNFEYFGGNWQLALTCVARI